MNNGSDFLHILFLFLFKYFFKSLLDANILYCILPFVFSISYMPHVFCNISSADLKYNLAISNVLKGNNALNLPFLSVAAQIYLPHVEHMYCLWLRKQSTGFSKGVILLYFELNYKLNLILSEKMIKQIPYIVFLVTMIIAIPSCIDLEEDTSSVLSIENLKSESGVTAALAPIYRSMLAAYQHPHAGGVPTYGGDDRTTLEAAAR